MGYLHYMGLAEHVTARKSLFLVSHGALQVSLLADYCWETKRREDTRCPVQRGRTKRRKADRFIGLWPNEMPFRNVSAYIRFMAP